MVLTGAPATGSVVKVNVESKPERLGDASSMPPDHPGALGSAPRSTSWNLPTVADVRHVTRFLPRMASDRRAIAPLAPGWTRHITPDTLGPLAAAVMPCGGPGSEGEQSCVTQG